MKFLQPYLTVLGAGCLSLLSCFHMVSGPTESVPSDQPQTIEQQEPIPPAITPVCIDRSETVIDRLSMPPDTASTTPAGPSGTWEVTENGLVEEMVFHSGSDPAINGVPAAAGEERYAEYEMASFLAGEPAPMLDMAALPSGGYGTPSTGAPSPGPGVLTAGQWHDHLHWREFQGFVREYPEHFATWRLDFQNRLLLQVTDSCNSAIPDAAVAIRCGGQTLMNGTTYADGSVVFFVPGEFAAAGQPFSAFIQTGADSFTVEIEAFPDDDQRWMVALPVKSAPITPAVDLVFMVDVTGSMSDELSYLQAELLDICGRVFAREISGLRVGLLFYRDRLDEFVTRSFDFREDLAGVQENFTTMQANGGGDFPESLNLALKNTIQNLSWHGPGTVRICFLIADAPPHYYSDEEYTYKEAIEEAAAKAIKIIPVAGSGIDKSTEYLFRHIAVRTMGRYIFITNDSGVGGSHIDPDIGEHEVEKLNDIIVRSIQEEIALWQMTVSK
jgi:hypothetical protein